MKSARRNQAALEPRATARWILAAGAFALAAWAPALAYDYVPPRVSHIEGSAAYEPAGDVDWSEVTLNLPLLSGDRVISHPDSRIEIELGYDNFLRLDENTDLVLRRTSDSEIELDLAVGDLILRVNDSARFRVNLPNATVQLKKEGLYRFSVEEDGFSRVAVRKGEAKVSNAARDRKVKSGEELVVDHPQSALQQVGYASREDDFDVWSDRRDAQFVSSLSAQYVGGRYAGVYDLDRYGEWRYVSHFGSTVWFPFPSSGWRPYLIGSWSWAPGWGWTWISFEPWGWLPYHYGRWAYYRDYGRWCWIPGGFSRWSPHVVDFYSGGGYIGWAPRGYYPGRGRGNVTIINNNTNIVNIGDWNRLRPRDGLTVVPEGQFRSRGGFDRVALDGPARRNVVEVLRPTTPEDLSPRPGRAGFRSNPAPAAGVGGPRVVGVGRAETTASGGSVPVNSLTPSNSGWTGTSRRSSPDSSQAATPAVGRERSPRAASPASVAPDRRQRGESGGVPSRVTAPANRSSSPAWTGRSRGATNPSIPAASPASRDRSVAPPRPQNPVRTAPPSRLRESRPSSYRGRSSRPPTRVTPSRPSRPSTSPSSVRPRTFSRPPASVSRPAPTRSAPPARAVRPANRQRPPS